MYGVLLYYKYAEIPNLDDLLTFYHSNCSSLSLLGRVRLSSRGVNVTVCNYTIPLSFFSFPTHFSLTGWRQLILSRDPHRSPQSLQLSVSRHWFQARQLSSAIKRQSSPGMWIHFSIYSDRRWTCHSQFSSAVKVTGYLKCRKASLCTWLPFFPPQYQ